MEGSDGSAELAIFLVEDNPCDVVLFKQILRKCSIPCSLTIATEGIEALRWLKSEIKAHNEGNPDLVFLDLNLPGKSGLEILAEMKADPALAAIPTAVLTGSDQIRDKQNCERLGVQAYFNKTEVLQDFFSLVNGINSFLSTLRRADEAPAVHQPMASAA